MATMAARADGDGMTLEPDFAQPITDVSLSTFVAAAT
jgi:hypothetical protein